jgi:hypothetical protein
MALITYVLGLSWRLFGCLLIGLFAGLCIGLWSEYFTSFAYRCTQGIAKAGRVGVANVIISGLAVGMNACVGPAILIAAVVLATFALADGVYGIALASTGLLSTLGITLATDAYGPVIHLRPSYIASFTNRSSKLNNLAPRNPVSLVTLISLIILIILIPLLSLIVPITLLILVALITR